MQSKDEVIALGLSFSASFQPCARPAPAPASALAASSSFDERCTRGQRSAGPGPRSQQPQREAVVFNLMAVGGTGLGKSTLLHAMFANEVYSEHFPGPCPRIKKTLQVESSQAVVEAAGLRLRLTLVDTPGIGDAVDNSKCFKPILASIDDRNYDYFNKDTDARTRARSDRRIHCCLYLIDPDGHDLQPFDVEWMKELQDKVNVIPIIAKADTMSTYDCYRFKRRLLREIAEQQIDVYDFPHLNTQEEQQTALKDGLPFAIVGFNTEVHEYGGKMVARRYQSGIAEVETLEHNDLSL